MLWSDSQAVLQIFISLKNVLICDQLLTRFFFNLHFDFLYLTCSSNHSYLCGVPSQSQRESHHFWKFIAKQYKLCCSNSILNSLLLQCPARVSILENSREFFWNFTSRSRSRVIFISLSLLDLDFQSFSFHFHFSKRVKGTKISPFFSRKKEWNFTPSFMKNLTILVSRVKNPKQIMSGIMNGDTQLFKIQQQIIQGSGFFYPYYPYLSLSQPSVPLKVWKAALSNFHSAQHQCHASHLGSLYLVSMQLKHEKPCVDTVQCNIMQQLKSIPVYFKRVFSFPI